MNLTFKININFFLKNIIVKILSTAIKAFLIYIYNILSYKKTCVNLINIRLYKIIR